MATKPMLLLTDNATRTPEPKNGLHGTQKRVEFVIKYYLLLNIIKLSEIRRQKYVCC